jgi:hypothetical protein
VTSCIVDSATIYIMVVKFRNTICPPPPQLSLHTRAALSSNSNGTRSVYNKKNPKSRVLYSVRCLWSIPVHGMAYFCVFTLICHVKNVIYSVLITDLIPTKFYLEKKFQCNGKILTILFQAALGITGRYS